MKVGPFTHYTRIIALKSPLRPRWSNIHTPPHANVKISASEYVCRDHACIYLYLTAFVVYNFLCPCYDGYLGGESAIMANIRGKPIR